MDNKQIFRKWPLIVSLVFFLIFLVTVLAKASSVSISANKEIICGNNVVDSGEQCDGSNLNNQTCVGLGYAGGTLRCNADCIFNASDCTAAGGGTGAVIVVGGGGGSIFAEPKLFKSCDFNGDGFCNIIDLSIMLFYFDKPMPTASRYDLNNDKRVDIIDISILLYYWV